MKPGPFLPALAAQRIARWAYQLGIRLADWQMTSRRKSGGKQATGEGQSSA